MLVMLVTNAVSERSISALHRVNIYLRETVTQQNVEPSYGFPCSQGLN